MTKVAEILELRTFLGWLPEVIGRHRFQAMMFTAPRAFHATLETVLGVTRIVRTVKELRALADADIDPTELVCIESQGELFGPEAISTPEDQQLEESLVKRCRVVWITPYECLLIPKCALPGSAIFTWVGAPADDTALDVYELKQPNSLTFGEVQLVLHRSGRPPYSPDTMFSDKPFKLDPVEVAARYGDY